MEQVIAERLQKKLDKKVGLWISNTGLVRANTESMLYRMFLNLQSQQAQDRESKIVTFDVEPAFNSAPQEEILDAARRRGISGRLKNMLQKLPTIQVIGRLEKRFKSREEFHRGRFKNRHPGGFYTMICCIWKHHLAVVIIARKKTNCVQ